jgi:hypothetical protein
VEPTGDSNTVSNRSAHLVGLVNLIAEVQALQRAVPLDLQPGYKQTESRLVGRVSLAYTKAFVASDNQMATQMPGH